MEEDMGKTLSVAIDMGAKNNGVFVALSEGSAILDKKAATFVINEQKINFSKKSRRENRHKDRNYKRHKLAKRLFEQLHPLGQYTQQQQELLRGLLNNRGYTFLSSSVAFEALEESSYDFMLKYLPQLGAQKSKEDFEAYLTDTFDEEDELKGYLKEAIKTIDQTLRAFEFYLNKKKIFKDIDNLSSEPSELKKIEHFGWIKDLFIRNKLKIEKKEVMLTKIKEGQIDLSAIDFDAEKKRIKSLEFDAEFVEFKKEIERDLKLLREFFASIIKEIDTGAKPRQKYLKEIQKEIETYDFVDDKGALFYLAGNISNLQLRILRKFFNKNSQHKSTMDMLSRYFKAFHYKTDKEKKRREALFEYLGEYPDDLYTFLTNTPPELTIPPYEDMNNRDTYKCNTLYIKPELITAQIREALDTVLSHQVYDQLKIDENGNYAMKEHIIHRTAKGNKTLAKDFTYSKYLQRFFDATPELTDDMFNPRNIFKHEKKLERGTIDTVELFKKEFGEEVYRILKQIANKYYAEEEQINSGLYVEEHSIFEKCNRNTPYKNNVKHLLLKPIYDEEFSKENKDADRFIDSIKNERGLKAYLEKIASAYSSYQNGFYAVLQACLEQEKCVTDKNIKSIVDGLEKALMQLKNALHAIGKNETYLEEISSIRSGETKLLNRFINTLIQTHDILFKDLGGFHKTCTLCTLENAIRSNENKVLAKRLLSDVGKPIDGMLDMMLDRIAFEISEEIDASMLKESDSIEIILEQNKFSFEQSLNDVKRAMNSSVKKLKREDKDRLNVPICPYTGENFNIIEGDWDHILPQSKGVYNSKANMILVSTKGNQQKGNQDYILERLHPKHLKEVFGTEKIEEIKKKITEGVESIDTDNFSNFDNLKLMQQIALRYALFMRDTPVFDKAFEIVKLDKIKNRSNGTQKRLARLIYEKLSAKHPELMNDKEIRSRVISSQLVSATRNYLAESNEALRKQTIQKPHSHAVDAMVLFYLANSKLKGAKHRQQKYVSAIVPGFEFGNIYLKESKIKELYSKHWYETNNPKYQISSKRLFDENDIGIGYLHIYRSGKKFKKGLLKNHDVDFSLTQKTFDYWIEKEIIIPLKNEEGNNKDSLFSVNKNKLYEILFDNKSEVLNNLTYFKKIEELRYTYAKTDPFEFTNKFLDPKSKDEKEAVKAILNQKERPLLEDITVDTLMRWYSRSNKLYKNGARLGYYKSWELFAKILSKNKNELFDEIEKESRKGEVYKCLHFYDDKALALCKKTLFKTTLTKKRKKKKVYSLYSASKSDTQYIQRRKNNKGDFIYQVRIANGFNKLKGYKKIFGEDSSYLFANATNVVPLTMKNYKKAFEKQ
jgi:Zn-finger nucleic acid-binding protein/anti-sigma28 factor (negative regulator of flagellin synthesis)